MISASEATTALTSALKSFNLAAEDAIEVVDKLTKVDQKAAVSAGGIATALQKSATSARLAGMSMDELIGSVSVIGEVTQQSMDTVGNAMKSILARYGNVKASVFTQIGLDDDGETSENINDIEKVLSKLGIRIRSSAGELRSITDVLDDVNEKWDTYDTVTKNAIATSFGGTRMRENFLVLIEQWDRVKELTEESANAAGTADEKYEAYMDSMEAATKRLQNAWESLSQSFEASPLIKGVTNITASVAESAIEGFGWLKKLMPLLLTLQSGSIIGAFTNPGQTGGFRGLLSNIPIIGDFVKRNDAIQQIAKDVHEIKEETAGSASKTKNEGALKKIWRGLTGRQDIVDPETGKSISYKDAAAYRKLLRSTSGGTALTDPQMNQFAKLLTKRQIGNAVFGGISATLAQLATTKEVGSGVGGWIGKLVTGNLGNEQTVEETAGGKALRTIVSGGLAALGGYFAGPLGAMLGQTIGEGAASIVSTIVHRSELEMKQRVADAKENLNRLDDLKSTIESNNSIMIEELTSSEDFEKLYKYTDDLYEKLFDLQYEGNVDIIGAFNNFAETVGNEKQIRTISDLVDEINNGNADQRSMIKRQLELAEAQVSLGELVKSQEGERSSINTTLSKGFEFSFKAGKYYIGGNDEAATKQTTLLEKLKGVYGLSNELGGRSTADRAAYYNFELAEGLLPEEKIKSLKDVLSIYDEAVETAQVSQDEYKRAVEEIENYIQSIKRALEEEKKLDKELIFNRSNVGFLAADIHDLTTTELKDLTVDGVVGRVVEALEAQGVEARNAAGYIKDEYQDAIEKLIKSNSKFNALQQADTKTLDQLTSAQKRFSSMLEEQVELVKEYGKSWDKWYDAAKRGELSEEIVKIVYAANPERIEQFARAWNTTREGLEKLTKEFPDLTTAIGLMSPSEVREYYSVFTDLFEDLAADSALTAENFEKLINQYPQLLKYYKNGTLSTELLKKANEEQKVAYANAMLSAELSSSGIGGDFLTAVKSVSMGEVNEEAARFVNLTKESAAAILKEIGSVKSLNEVLDKANALRQKGDEDAARALEELVEQYLNYEKVIEWIDPIYAMAQQGEIDRLTQEIENLNEQKDALSNVNDERRRELDLIKAKEALENARKEKKRVYRAGLGFVMESDEEAISAAQENLDKLNIEKQQEDIQYQIEQLESLKSILENLDEEKQKEANKKALEEYFGEGMSKLANSELVTKLVDGFAKSRASFNFGTGEIKDADGNITGKFDGLKGAEDSKNEQASSAKTALVGGKDPEGKDVTGAFENFKKKKEEFESVSSDKIGTKEYREAAENYREAKEDLETKLSEAKSAGVDEETVETGSNLLKSYQEPTAIDWKRLDNLSNPSAIKGRQVKKGTHNVMLNTNSVVSSKDVDHEFGDNSASMIKKYDPTSDTWGEWESLGNASFAALPDYTIIMNQKGDDSYAWIKNGTLYWLRGVGPNAPAQEDGTWGKKWATGTLSSPEGLSLINELGTEAVITPGGTLTALPSKTGIVPADITKNVWALGEVAPTLVAQLSSLTQKTPTGNVGNTTYEEGQYFDNFTMNVYPAKSDDFNKILEQARAQMRLTRHNN